jgi:hypothetical protein
VGQKKGTGKKFAWIKKQNMRNSREDESKLKSPIQKTVTTNRLRLKKRPSLHGCSRALMVMVHDVDFVIAALPLTHLA